MYWVDGKMDDEIIRCSQVVSVMNSCRDGITFNRSRVELMIYCSRDGSMLGCNRAKFRMI